MAIPEISFDPLLIERAVVLTLERAHENGAPGPEREYRELADEAYDEPPGAARSEKFAALHQRLFRSWKLDRPFREALEPWPEVTSRVRAVLAGLSGRDAEEGADLGGTARDLLGILVDPRRLGDERDLARFLDRELAVVRDLLDPAFAYDPGLELPVRHPTEKFLARERLRLLWGIRAERAVEASGRPAPGARDAFQKRVRALWPELGDAAAPIFERLWSTPPAAYPAMLKLLEDRGAMETLAPGAVVDPDSRRRSGAACPLCGFPTHDWGVPESGLEPAIRSDFPGWRREDGSCARCVEGYRVLAEKCP